MPKKLNALLRTELRKRFEAISSGVWVNYQGLRSDETYGLRKELNQKKIKIQVVKNSIAAVSLKEAGVGDTGDILKGPVAFCFGDDPVAVAGAIVEYKRKNRKTKLEIKGGLLDRKVIPAAEVQRLAALPGRQQLLAQLAGTLNAPITGLVQVSAGILRKLLYALLAVKENMEKEGGAAAPAA